MPKTILFVDNDASLLQGLDTLFKGYTLAHASTYKDALKQLNTIDDCRVLIAELGLEDKCGIAFLTAVLKKHPRVVRVAVSEHKDFSVVCDALNKARIFQFVPKPCPPKELKKHIVEALALYDRETERRQAMQRSLIGNVKALIDILDMVHPEAMGFAKRIRQRVLDAGKKLGVKPLWQLELAVMLSHIGCVALPSEILKKMDHGGPLNPEEARIFGMHPTIAADLLSNIDQMAPIANIIKHQHELVTNAQPIESRIIKIALDLDRWERKGKDSLAILNQMDTHSDKYDTKVIKVMQELLCQSGSGSVTQLNIEELREGMIIAQDLVNKDGVKLLLRGQSISKASLIRLQNFHIALGIMDRVHVLTESCR